MYKNIRNILYFFYAIVVSKLFGTVTSLIVAKILKPDDYGVWIILLLIISYASILSLGSVEALLKKLPFYRGRNDHRRALEVEQLVFTLVTFSAIILCTIAFFYLLYIIKNGAYSSLPIPLLLITASINNFSSYFFYRFQALNEFNKVSLIETLRSILRFVFVIILAWKYGLLGAVIGLFLHELIIFLYSYIKSKNGNVYLKLKMEFNSILEIIRIGLPITIIMWVFIIQTSLDRLISISFIGREATGFYGLGVSIVSIIYLLPQAIGRVLYPKINEGIAKNINNEEISLLVIKPSNILAILSPILINLIVILLPITYYKIFPNYLQGLLSAKILIYGSFFICLFRNGSNYLIGIDKHKLVLKYAVISLLINIFGNIVLVKLGYYIEGIALSTSFSGAILTTLVWKSVYKYMGFSFRQQLIELTKIYFPFTVFLVLMVIIKILLVEYEASIEITIVQIFLFLILYCLFLFFFYPYNKWVKELKRILIDNRNKKGII